MFDVVNETKNISVPKGAKIKVVAVGGGGGNALNYMIEKEMQGVEFICANTDLQALNSSKSERRIQLGKKRTQGLGSGANPEIAQESAEEVIDVIQEQMEGADMVFIAAGLGGGTGTGASPILARVAKESGALTIAVVSKPFAFEGKKRMSVANRGFQELSKYVDSLICIPNTKLVDVLGGDITMVDAFAKANDVLYGAVQGISELITHEGLINLDFADVRTVMSNTGMAMIGSGKASGEGRAKEAAMAAINNPLLEDIDIKNAYGLLVNVTANQGMTMKEFQEVNECAQAIANEDAEYVSGAVVDPNIGDTLRVAIVATGLKDTHQNQLAEKNPEGKRTCISTANPACRNVENSVDIGNGHANNTAPDLSLDSQDDFPDLDGDSKFNSTIFDIPAVLRGGNSLGR